MKSRKKKAAAVQGTRATAETKRQKDSSVVPTADAGNFAKLQARAARAGHALLALGSGFLLVTSWGEYHCPSLSGVAAALRGRASGEAA